MAMSKNKGKELEKKGKDNVPDNTPDYGEMKGAGFEKIKGSDLAIPFISILQTNSPQVESNSPEGSKAGMLFNTVTKQITDGKKGILFQPCEREDVYAEWTPRESGGGLQGRHAPDSKLVKDALAAAKSKFGKMTLPNGNLLVDTSYVYGLVLSEDGKSVESFAVLSCWGTKKSPFKAWMTDLFLIKGKPPMFAFRTYIRTFDDSNKKGKYKNFLFEPFNGSTKASMILPGDPLLNEGQDFQKMVQSGMAKAAFDTLTPEPDHEEGDNGQDAKGDGNAPF